MLNVCDKWVSSKSTKMDSELSCKNQIDNDAI